MKIYLYLKHFPIEKAELSKGEGTRKAVHGLASGLAACGVDVTVICEGEEENFVETSEGYKIACFCNSNINPCFSIAPSLQKYMLLHRHNSLVILNGIFHRSVYTFSVFLRRHSISYIVAPHDPYHPAIFQKNAYLKIPYWLLFERRLLIHAKAVQVLDIRHGHWLRRLGVHNPVLEVPNGFLPDDTHLSSTLTWKKEGIPKIFFLGRIDAHNKGLDILLNALSRIVKTTDVHLTIQGPDWGDRPTLERLTVQLGLSSKVKFSEPDYQLSSPSLIANYDIFCIPSRFEGFSLSALEAMLAGRVLLISEVAGIAPHVLESDCGIVVKPNVEAISEGFQDLLHRRREWETMGLRGRQYVLERLDWQNIASNALNQYQLLAG